MKKTTPLETIKRLSALADAFAELDIPIHKLNGAALALQQHFESFPIHTDHIKPGWWQGFVLTCGEWWPCHAMNENVNGDTVSYRIDYVDGASESGIALKYKWAHCTADDTVNYHWLDAVDVPEESVAADALQDE
jgi:hypothetical protein